jgi:hypothetical protein
MRGGRGGMRGGFADRGGFGDRGGRGGRGGFGNRPPFYNDRRREGGQFNNNYGERRGGFRGGMRKEEEGGEDRAEKTEVRAKVAENEGEGAESHNPNVVHMD